MKILALFIAIGAVLVTGLVAIPVLPSYAVDMDNEGGGSAPAPSASEGNDDEDGSGGSSPAEQEDDEDESGDKESSTIDTRQPVPDQSQNTDNSVNEPFNTKEIERNFEEKVNSDKLSPIKCKKRGIIDEGISKFDNTNLNECMARLGTEGVGEYIGGYITGCMDNGRDILSCQNDVKPVIVASAPKSD